MAKSKDQKRREALVRLEKRMAEDRAKGRKPTFSQRMEHNALTYPKRVKSEAEKFSEKLFGAGDPVTGIIYVDPLPWDFKPTPELQAVVDLLQGSIDRFIEVQVSLNTPEGYSHPTYEGNGNYMSQWVSRHTRYTVHHGKNLYGSSITIVFSLKDEIPEYDEDNQLIRGTTQEVYERSRINW